MTAGKMKKLIDVATGRVKADEVIKNATILDVFNGGWMRGDVAVCGDRIAGIGRYSGKRETEGEGKYVIPSMYDAHLHFESVMVRPSEYLKIAVPKGVTAFNADPHEIANVLGEKGVRFMKEDVRGIPVDVNFMMPSCVPAAPEDHSGCVLDAAAVRRISRAVGAYGLGEMMNYPGVIGCDPDVLAKIASARIVDGHAPSLSGAELNAYAACGVLTDHECESVEEAREKVSRGMYVLIREGSQTKNLRTLIRAVDKTNLRRFLFCTDDRNIEDLVSLGTIGNCVRLAVECGMSPAEALTIATLNAYEAYGMARRGAIAPGYYADMLLCGDEIAGEVLRVYHHGRAIAENGRPLFRADGADTSGVRGTVHIKEVTPESLELRFEPGMPVMRVFPDSVVTEAEYPESAEGLDLMCCIERHDASGEIGKCFVRGFGMKNCAVAQTVGHDSHNITVLGDNTRDMALAVNSLGADGGLVLVKEGRVTGKLPLEIGGLMTDAPAEKALEVRKALRAALDETEHDRRIEPFMLLSFLTLIVIPEVKLNTKGLFDVSNWKYLYKN